MSLTSLEGLPVPRWGHGQWHAGHSKRERSYRSQRPVCQWYLPHRSAGEDNAEV